MTSKDVTSVEYSRMLKRAGFNQDTQAYWQGIIPSLTSVQGLSAIATEEKGKMRWLLVIGRPPEPNASAYTLQELQDYLKSHIETHIGNQEFPKVRLVKKQYICSIGTQDMFTAPTEADAFAQAVLRIIK